MVKFELKSIKNGLFWAKNDFVSVHLIRCEKKLAFIFAKGVFKLFFKNGYIKLKTQKFLFLRISGSTLIQFIQERMRRMNKNNDERILRMYEPLVVELELYFPNVYEKMVSWKPSGPMQILVTTNIGKRYEYNSITKYIHVMPEASDNLLYEDENRWREEFKYKLIKRMSNMDIDQNELAALSGLSVQSISHYMNTRSTPSGFHLTRIARALDCSISELMDFHMDDEEE